MCIQTQVFSLLRLVVKHQSFTTFQTKFYHRQPFLELYSNVTGKTISHHNLNLLKKKHPNINTLTMEQLQCTLQILEKFNISAYEACEDPHVFCMNPITMDNYGEILRECGFVNIIPKYIIRYHTLVRSRTVEQLKKNGLLEDSVALEDRLEWLFHKWPDSHKIMNKFDESSTSILTIRLSILERYLNWKLNVTTEEFQKYCKNYLPLKHRPMSDIQEAIRVALEDIGFDLSTIRRNGFIISSDPVNTKLIIENVPTIAGMNIKEVIKTEPAILKNNFNGINQIRNIVEEHNVPEEAQRRCLKIYCMCPKTVRERLEELKTSREYQVLKPNPRMLEMVVHKRKMMHRIDRMLSVNKQCFTLNHLVSSTKVFNNYVSGFGSKVWGGDIACLLSDSLKIDISGHETNGPTDTSKTKRRENRLFILRKMKRHTFWRHIALHVIDNNIRLLQKWFNDDVIFNNCQLLLYPAVEIQQYIDFFLSMRNTVGFKNDSIPLDPGYNTLNYSSLTDEQILSLILYEIEKKFHFSGDGIWDKNDARAETHLAS